MVIPRSPSPTPLEEREEEDLSREEMRELIRRQRERLAVKQENEAPKVKRERPLSSVVPMRRLKSSRTSDGKEIFHLDSDDDDGELQPTLQRSPQKKQAEAVEIVDLY